MRLFLASALALSLAGAAFTAPQSSPKPQDSIDCTTCTGASPCRACKK